MNKEEILALTIADLKLPLRTASWIVRLALPRPRTEVPWHSLEYAEQQRLRRAFTKEIADSHDKVTVKAALASLPPYTAPIDLPYGRGNRSLVMDRFFDKLARLGLTTFDCLYIRHSTLTPKVMRSLSKEEWLSKPAYLLGTLSSTALRNLDDLTESRKPGAVTVGDLMKGQFTDTVYGGFTYSGRKLVECGVSFEKTRTLLRKLGFSYEDGDFMQIGTERRKIEQLAKRHAISKRSATTVVRIARKEGWVRIVD